MNPLIEEIYRTKRVQDSEGNYINPFPSSIEYETGEFLYNFVRKIKAAHTLEIGMACGLSALFICQAHHDNGGGCHTAIDPMESTLFKSAGLSNIKRAGLEKNFRFYEAKAHQILPRLLIDNERFDLIFIDGGHLFDYTLVSFFYADQLLKAGGYLIFHDTWMPSVRKVLRFILQNRRYCLDSISLWKPAHRRRERRIAFLSKITRIPIEKYYLLLLSLPFMCNLPNYCALKKMGDDERKYNHYRPF